MIRILLLHILTCALLLSSCQPADVDTTEALPFSNDGKTWGLIATDGTVILPANSLQHRPSPIVGGMFSMSDSTGRIYLYDSRHPSSPVSQRSFVSIGHFFESVTPALEASEGPILLIDKQGNNVASTAQYPQYEIVLMHNFSNGLALFATASGKYGYMDTRGNIAIPPLYDRAYDFHEGLALVGNTNSQGQTGYLLIDTDGQTSTAIGLSNSLLDTRIAGNRLLFYNISSRHLGFLNRKSDLQFYLPDHIDQASRYLYDMAVIRSKHQKGLIDLQGNILLPPVYENIHVAGPELVALKKDSLWGITDLTDNPAIHFRYDSIGHYYGSGQAIARKQGRSFFINRQGEPAGETYAYILEDSTASRLCPQRFLIHMPAQASTAEPAAQPLQAQANADVPSQQDRKEDTPTANTSRIEQNDWKQISKQHPFYQEAIKVVSGKLEEKDAENRRMILNYVEHLLYDQRYRLSGTAVQRECPYHRRHRRPLFPERNRLPVTCPGALQCQKQTPVPGQAETGVQCQPKHRRPIQQFPHHAPPHHQRYLWSKPAAAIPVRHLFRRRLSVPALGFPRRDRPPNPCTYLATAHADRPDTDT